MGKAEAAMAMVATAPCQAEAYGPGGEGGGGGEEGGVGDGDVAVMERLAATTERRGDAAATMVVAKVAARVAVKAEVEEGGEGRVRLRYWLRQGAHRAPLAKIAVEEREDEVAVGPMRSKRGQWPTPC